MPVHLPARCLVVLAALAAILTLSACSQTAEAAPATSSPAPSGSSTATPTQAVVPFGGDCSKMLTAADAGALLGAGAAVSQPSLDAVPPDLNASLGLIGSVSCLWTTDDGKYLQTAVFPISQTSPEVVATKAGAGCDDGYPTCWASRTAGSSWIYAESTDAHAASGSLALVADRMSGAPNPAPGPRQPGWWTVPSCDRLTQTVSGALKITSLEAGFPGDSVPSGAVWDTAHAAGAVGWCSWYSQNGAHATIIELYVQPGAGHPDAQLIEEAGGTPRTVAGADAAWSLAPDGDTSRLLTMSGDNRLTVSGTATATQIAAVASAVIGSLNAG